LKGKKKMSEVEKGLTSAFIGQSAEHHRKAAGHHEDLSESHAAISECFKGENALLHKHFAKSARAHHALHELHKAHAEAWQHAASGLDEESRSFLADVSQGELHRAADDELDPELRDLVGH
jgi:hypothetical protein